MIRRASSHGRAFISASTSPVEEQLQQLSALLQGQQQVIDALRGEVASLRVAPAAHDANRTSCHSYKAMTVEDFRALPNKIILVGERCGLIPTGGHLWGVGQGHACGTAAHEPSCLAHPGAACAEPGQCGQHHLLLHARLRGAAERTGLAAGSGVWREHPGAHGGGLEDGSSMGHGRVAVGGGQAGSVRRVGTSALTPS